MMTQAERFALDYKGQSGVDGPHPCALVLAEEPRVLVRVPGGVELPAEGRRVGQRRLEPLTGAAEGRRLLLSHLGVDAPVCVLEPSHRRRATAST